MRWNRPRFHLIAFARTGDACCSRHDGSSWTHHALARSRQRETATMPCGSAEPVFDILMAARAGRQPWRASHVGSLRIRIHGGTYMTRSIKLSVIVATAAFATLPFVLPQAANAQTHLYRPRAAIPAAGAAAAARRRVGRSRPRRRSQRLRPVQQQPPPGHGRPGPRRHPEPVRHRPRRRWPAEPVGPQPRQSPSLAALLLSQQKGRPLRGALSLSTSI